MITNREGILQHITMSIRAQGSTLLAGLCYPEFFPLSETTCTWRWTTSLYTKYDEYVEISPADTSTRCIVTGETESSMTTGIPNDQLPGASASLPLETAASLEPAYCWRGLATVSRVGTAPAQRLGPALHLDIPCRKRHQSTCHSTDISFIFSKYCVLRPQRVHVCRIILNITVIISQKQR
jgi:hypothetical protein